MCFACDPDCPDCTYVTPVQGDRRVTHMCLKCWQEGDNGDWIRTDRGEVFRRPFSGAGMSPAQIRKAVRKIRHAQPNSDGYYYAIVHPDAVEDLKDVLRV